LKGIAAMSEVMATLTTSDAAKIVGLSESTLAKLRLYGNGPTYCKLGRRVVYRPADLDAWLQSRTVQDTTEAEEKFTRQTTAKTRA
jgi:predicted DNA-binding transcriptional regulator AlpA